MRYKRTSIGERDAVVDRLREFLRLNYMTAAEVARRGGFGPVGLDKRPSCRIKTNQCGKPLPTGILPLARFGPKAGQQVSNL
jgi:hypothetical protein